jgi:hypothetical protein
VALVRKRTIPTDRRLSAKLDLTQKPYGHNASNRNECASVVQEDKVLREKTQNIRKEV